MRALAQVLLVAIGLAVASETAADVAVASGGLAPLPPPPAVRSEEADLGRLLFFDARLSGDVAVRCASCHDPVQAWGDSKPLAAAYPGSLGYRNSKSVLNVAYARLLFWDGRMGGDDLPSQVRDQITESHNMNLDGRIMQERLKQVSEYVDRFDRVYGGEPSFGRTLKAIAAFEKTLVTRDSPLDRHLRGDPSALPAAAKRGLDLFTGRAGCVGCHSGPMLSDYRAHDLGVPAHADVLGDPLRHITLRSVSKGLGVPGYETLRSDPGYFAVTKRAEDRGAFITPSLREVTRTAPYMHNGTLPTLESVVDFYDRGGGEPTARKTELEPLGLSADERADLVAFMRALSGELPNVEVPQILPNYALIPLGRDGGDLADLVRPDLEIEEPPSTAELDALPLTPPIPRDNPMSDAKLRLGKMLFFDPRVGGDASTACSTCHEPKIGWGEGNRVSRGYPGTVHWRNSQTIVNAAYYDKLFWAGAAFSLEKQAPSAAKGGVAGNGEVDMMEERLRQIPVYVGLFQEAFGTEAPTIMDAWKAIAAFERTIVQPDTPFDRYMRGDAEAIPTSARRGLELFRGKAHCADCHSGALLTDQRFHRLGVPEIDVFQQNALAQITFRYEHYAKGVSEDMYRKVRTDLGLYYRTKRPEHIGKFRTPSLRYTQYSKPYMHNGAFSSLEEVVDFYDAGGGDVPGKSSLLSPLGLTGEEKADLLAFLGTLTGPEILMDPPVLPPYEVMK